MFGFGSLLNTSNLQGVMKKVLGSVITFIITFTLAIFAIGPFSSIALQSKDDGYCEIAGEATDRLSPAAAAGATANETWMAATTHNVLTKTGTNQCAAGTAITANDVLYTPQGEKLTFPTAVAANAAITGSNNPTAVWKPQSKSMGAGGLSVLIEILFGVGGLLIPAGALGFLGRQVKEMLPGKAGMIVVIVGALLLAATFKLLLEPLDVFFTAMDGNRYYIFSQGVGKIAATIADFLGIALVMGIVGFAVLVFPSGAGGGAMRRMRRGRRRMRFGYR